eukprot:g687.t1
MWVTTAWLLQIIVMQVVRERGLPLCLWVILIFNVTWKLTLYSKEPFGAQNQNLRLAGADPYCNLTTATGSLAHGRDEFMGRDAGGAGRKNSASTLQDYDASANSSSPSDVVAQFADLDLTNGTPAFGSPLQQKERPPTPAPKSDFDIPLSATTKLASVVEQGDESDIFVNVRRRRKPTWARDDTGHNLRGRSSRRHHSQPPPQPSSASTPTTRPAVREGFLNPKASQEQARYALNYLGSHAYELCIVLEA